VNLAMSPWSKTLTGQLTDVRTAMGPHKRMDRSDLKRLHTNSLTASAIARAEITVNSRHQMRSVIIFQRASPYGIFHIVVSLRIWVPRGTRYSLVSYQTTVSLILNSGGSLKVFLRRQYGVKADDP